MRTLFFALVLFWLLVCWASPAHAELPVCKACGQYCRGPVVYKVSDYGFDRPGFLCSETCAKNMVNRLEEEEAARAAERSAKGGKLMAWFCGLPIVLIVLGVGGYNYSQKDKLKPLGAAPPIMSRSAYVPPEGEGGPQAPTVPDAQARPPVQRPGPRPDQRPGARPPQQRPPNQQRPPGQQPPGQPPTRKRPKIGGR